MVKYLCKRLFMIKNSTLKFVFWISDYYKRETLTYSWFGQIIRYFGIGKLTLAY